MIRTRVEIGELSAAAPEVLARPVRSDGVAVTAAGRRLDKAGGPAMTRHLESLGELPVGSAVLTPAGDLAASYLLHLVLQSVEEPFTEVALRRALAQGFERMVDWGLRSLALPPLGTGAGGLTIEEGARVLAEVLSEHEDQGRPGFEVVVVVESDFEREAFERALDPGAGG